MCFILELIQKISGSQNPQQSVLQVGCKVLIIHTCQKCSQLSCSHSEWGRATKVWTLILYRRCEVQFETRLTCYWFHYLCWNSVCPFCSYSASFLFSMTSFHLLYSSRRIRGWYDSITSSALLEWFHSSTPPQRQASFCLPAMFKAGAARSPSLHNTHSFIFSSLWVSFFTFTWFHSKVCWRA